MRPNANRRSTTGTGIDRHGTRGAFRGLAIVEHAADVPVLFVHGDDDPTLPYGADVGPEVATFTPSP